MVSQRRKARKEKCKEKCQEKSLFVSLFVFFASLRLCETFLLDLGEGDADGCAGIEHVARGRQTAGLRIDAEDDDVVGVLVGRKKECAGWIDGEVARNPSLSR